MSTSQSVLVPGALGPWGPTYQQGDTSSKISQAPQISWASLESSPTTSRPAMALESGLIYQLQDPQATAKPGSAHQWVSTSPGTPQSSTVGHLWIWLHPTTDQPVLASLYSQSQALVIWPYPPSGHPRLCNQSQHAPTPPNGRSTSALANLGLKPATTQPHSPVGQHPDRDSPGHAASSSEVSFTSSQQPLHLGRAQQPTGPAASHAYQRVHSSQPCHNRRAQRTHTGATPRAYGSAYQGEVCCWASQDRPTQYIETDTNTRGLDNVLLNNQWITEEIKEEIEKYLEINENQTTMIQILRVTAKAVLRGKLIAIKSYLRKQEKSQINNLTLHLKLEKEKQTNLKIEGNKS